MSKPISFLCIAAVLCLGCSGRDLSSAAATPGKAEHEQCEDALSTDPVATAQPDPPVDHATDRSRSEPAADTPTLRAKATADSKRHDDESAKKAILGQLIAEALKTIDLLSFEDKKAEKYCEIASIQMRLADLPGVRSTLDLALEAAAKETSTYNKVRAYGLVLAVQMQIPDADAAKETTEIAASIAQKCPDEGTPVLALCELAAIHAARGERAQTRQSLSAARKAAANSSGKSHVVPPRWYIRVAKSQQAAGDVEDAQETLSLALSAAETESEYTRGESDEDNYKEMASFQARTQDFAGAAASLSRIRKTSKDEFYDTLVYLQFHDGDLAGAAASLTQLVDETKRQRHYCSLMHKYMEAGDVASAKSTIRFLAPNDVPYMCAKLAGIQAKSGDPTAARESLRLAQSRPSASDTTPDALCAIAVAQSLCGDRANAREDAKDAIPAIRKRLNDSHPKMRELAANVLSGLSASGDGAPAGLGRPATSGEQSAVQATGERSVYLEQLLDDPVFGKANRAIAAEIGNQLSKSDLGIRLGTVNELATKAGVSADGLLSHFQKAVETAKAQGLSSVTALGAVSGSLAFKKAYEDQK